MTHRDWRILDEFKKRISPDVSRSLRKLIVFGSRAKGEESDDSDLDLIALVDARSEEIDRILDDIAYQVMWDFDFKPVLSLKVFAEDEFKKCIERGFSFYRNVEREGLSI
ncbi:MAG: nucleotidyltransferase domain-containing protein [Candidatus Xenobiia bacterium LiM19]